MSTILEDKTADAVAEIAHDSVLAAELVNELAAAEGNLPVMESMKIYAKAVFWSLFVSMGVIMVGYNSQIILSLFALPAFVNKYGTTTANGTKTLTAGWQIALSMCYIGEVIGALGIGWFYDRYGRKNTMIACNFACIAAIFIIFFAPNATVLTVGEVIAGIPWGGFTTIAPLYAAEVSPVALRGMLTAFINMAWIIGQLVGQGVTKATSSRVDEWGYRIPFAIQWAWCVLLAIGIPFAPESPWYLVHKGRKAEAKKSLLRLVSANSPVNIDQQIEVIEKTDQLERSLQESSTYMDLFRGVNLRRTEIANIAYCSQVLSGIPLSWYCNYFFTLAGLSTVQSFNLGVGNTAVGFVGTACTFFYLSYVGRRKAYVSGLTIMTTIMFVIAILDVLPHYGSHPSYSWAQSILLIVWSFFYQLTVGPLSYVYISEVPSTKLKGRSIALSTAAFFFAMIVVSVALPYLFNPGAADLRGKVGFVFGGTSLATLIWAYFRLPETAGRKYAEIDYMFENNVPARHFAKYQVAGFSNAEEK
ncbi:hypothetical protein N7510_002285 [Penicillium lagena]|uniref:uncharacterized protein n=1 Tax=Penicillium lagena TaxID=94218 RepID=UPI002540C97A|nr:uncharacterized protein N7510_002285 [Penicillium lagena]KAJ5625976.1 hypothetical protein N7510_002285 [Penicillium lagena]